MTAGSIITEWECGDCGNIRRTSVDDAGAFVGVFRPQGWIIDRGRVLCDQCAGDQASVPAAPAPNRSDEIRERLDSLRAGQAGGGAGVNYGEAAQAVRQPPARLIPGGGGISSAAVAPGAQGGAAGAVEMMRTGEHRSGNFTFVDTRKDEFLGPPMEVAGVPRLTEKCVGIAATGGPCGRVIQDGTQGGLSEQWRLAKDSTFERGHSACLDRAGR